MRSEFDFIENLRTRQPARTDLPPAAIIGIGDDCAVLPKDALTDTVITTDLLVEDIDFSLAWTTPEFIGHKALAVSLSDVAAMGAKPVWSMTSIGVPEAIWQTDFVEKFYDGYLRLANQAGVQLIGGDVSRTPDKIVIDSIVAGETGKGKAVLRSGAHVGDLICVTGSLGGAAFGLKLLQSGAVNNSAGDEPFLARQLTPRPQLAAGRILGENGLATAMIDLSDGLSSDLAHLCRSGSVGAVINAALIPVQKEFLNAQPPLAPDEILDFAVNGGEDFELLFTINPKNKERLEDLLSASFSCSIIGEITAQANVVELFDGDHRSILGAAGFRHF